MKKLAIMALGLGLVVGSTIALAQDAGGSDSTAKKKKKKKGSDTTAPPPK